jgi:hypothetical protein
MLIVFTKIMDFFKLELRGTNIKRQKAYVPPSEILIYEVKKLG